MTDMKLPDSAAMIQAHKEYRARCKESNAFVTIEQAREDDFYSGYMAAVEYFNSTIEAEIKRLRDDVSMLWMLLDDIDTLDDAAKDNDALFRKICYKIQQKRWKIKDPFFMEQTALAEKGDK